ncbi:MAG TPA: preprotein translocase subunit SecE [Solirubrobacteraceae bacterium]|nr:preprotein translocase subunit SecE [Solirubrobacteraceae bacterium]
MARNRQRARDRKQQQKLHRENVPGSLDHASGEVEGAEAAIVAGAAGIPDDTVDDAGVGIDDDFDAGTVEDERLGKGAGELAPAHAAARPHRGGSRLLHFLGACWAELQRVDWPNRRQVGQATAVVLGFVVFAGAFLGLADVIAQKIVDFIL